MLCIVLPDRALALLVVWSFLAGFSERLVPHILTSTEKKLTAAPQT
jgi:ABC-type maltose transport system permease subunit